MLNNTIKKNGENLCQLADYLLENRKAILSNWKERALGDADLEVMESLSRREFFDHVPEILDLFDKELRHPCNADQPFESPSSSIQFENHGLSRWQQGFSITELVRDWNHLRCAILRSITKAVTDQPETLDEEMAAAVNLLANLVAEGVNQSVAKFEEIRQAEARSHAIDLRNTIHDLREIYRQQTDLYRDAGHDLVGHLGILSSITHVFRNRSEDKNLENLYAPLSQGLGVAVEILEDVRLQATLESGQAKLFKERFDAVNWMRNTLAPYLMLAKEKSIDLEITGPSDLHIETDAAKLTRIVQNLMHNALKFTLKGSIKVEWGICSKSTHYFVRIENKSRPSPTPASLPLGMQMVQATFASATHIGRSNSKQRVGEQSIDNSRAVPDKSHRVDPLATSREGLGLSIAKRLANLLGGRLDIEKDNVQHGARATLSIPYRDDAPSRSRLDRTSEGTPVGG